MWGAVEIVAMLCIEILVVGLNTISKASMTRGMNTFVFTTYSSAIGLLFLLPLAFFYHRLVTPPKLTFSIVGRIFILGLIGYFLVISSFIGIGYSSPSMASAMNNLTPAYTFILALIIRDCSTKVFKVELCQFTVRARKLAQELVNRRLRVNALKAGLISLVTCGDVKIGMEKLDLKLKSSQTKLIGTIVSVVGALIVTLYKGQTIFFAPQNSSSTLDHTFESSTQQNWVLGGFFLAASSFSLALLIIWQTGIVKDYPSEVIITLISTIFSVMISTIVSLIVVKEPNEWELHLDLELISILYSAIFMVVCRNVINSWVLRKMGPVFVTMFKPLEMIIALIMGITFLGDSLYLGSVIGAILIALGFYSVLWGKVDEEKEIADSETRISLHLSFDKLPLLTKENMKD